MGVKSTFKCRSGSIKLFYRMWTENWSHLKTWNFWYRDNHSNSLVSHRYKRGKTFHMHTAVVMDVKTTIKCESESIKLLYRVWTENWSHSRSWNVCYRDNHSNGLVSHMCKRGMIFHMNTAVVMGVKTAIKCKIAHKVESEEWIHKMIVPCVKRKLETL